MSQHQTDDDRQVMDMGLNLLMIVLGIVLGLLVVSQWLTRMLFQLVVNPLLDGLLDRHDGAVVLLSAGLWGGVAAVILFPLAISYDLFGPAPQGLGQVWLVFALLGLLWGLIIGVWILSIWWLEAANQMPVGYDVVQLLDTPIDIRQHANAAAAEDVDDQLVRLEDHDLEQLILGSEAWQ